MRILIAILLGTLLIGCVYKSNQAGNLVRIPELKLAKSGYEIIGETSGKGCSFDDPFHKTTRANLKRYVSFDEMHPVLSSLAKAEGYELGGSGQVAQKSKINPAVISVTLVVDFYQIILAAVGIVEYPSKSPLADVEKELANSVGVESERNENPIRKGSGSDQRDAYNIALYKALENLGADALIDVKVNYDEKYVPIFFSYFVNSNACATVTGTGIKFTGPKLVAAGKTTVFPKKK